MLELQAGGAHFGPGPTLIAPALPSYVEVPTPYTNGFTYPGAGGGSMLVPATRAPTYNPCETPRSAYDDWWCNEGRRQGVPWGAATWGGSVNGFGSAVSELLGEGDVPGWKSALVGLGVVTALAFVLTAGAERVLGLKRNARPRRTRRFRRNGLFSTVRVVVTLEPNGRYTGHVIDQQSGQTLAVTYAEESPFVAKREADKLAVRIERQRAKEGQRILSPYRVTPTGTRLSLVPPRRPKK